MARQKIPGFFNHDLFRDIKSARVKYIPDYIPESRVGDNFIG